MSASLLTGKERKPDTRGACEARDTTRHVVGDHITCRIVAEALECWAIRVQNLSAGGINLTLDRVVPCGKLISAEIYNTMRKFCVRRELRVVYTLQNPTGGLMIGGSFQPALTDKELERLLY